MRHQGHVLRHDRADCRVGDWVLASAVPEWRSDRVRQTFVPPPSPSRGSVAIREPGPWVFLGSFYLDRSGTPVEIWRRES